VVPGLLYRQENLNFLGFYVVSIIYLKSGDPLEKSFYGCLNLVFLDQTLQILIPFM